MNVVDGVVWDQFVLSDGADVGVNCCVCAL